jgi:hypothetical protein
MGATDERTPARADAAAKLLELTALRRISESLYVVAVLGIADLIAHEMRSAEELAAVVNVHAPSLGRVLRLLVSFGVLRQDETGRFGLTGIGEFLRSDVEGSLRSAAIYYGGEKSAQIEGMLLHSVRTGEAARRRLLGAGGFGHLERDPQEAALFNSVMSSYSVLHLTGVLEAYDFSGISKLVDVGGGQGKNLTEILKHNPAMRGVLFDMPHAAEGGRKTIAEAGLSDRCEVSSGDFFQAVPVGADGYLLSRVIHDWDDAQAIAILKVVRAAIAPQGRLILLETMLRPDARTVYPLLSDLNMLLRTGGCERTEDEYRELFLAAGFSLTRTVETTSPTGATVIEGHPA